jgi:hypothetical protein
MCLLYISWQKKQAICERASKLTTEYRIFAITRAALYERRFFLPQTKMKGKSHEIQVRIQTFQLQAVYAHDHDTAGLYALAMSIHLKEFGRFAARPGISGSCEKFRELRHSPQTYACIPKRAWLRG